MQSASQVRPVPLTVPKPLPALLSVSVCGLAIAFGVPEKTARQRQGEREGERSEDDRPPRELEVRHTAMVPRAVSRVCHDSVPKVIPFVSAVSMLAVSLLH